MKFKITPGPWMWKFNKSIKSVFLVSFQNGSVEIVMDFVRYGIYGAKPRFNVDDRMVASDNLCKTVPGREHHSSWLQTITHPDARLIAAAPEMLDLLVRCSNAINADYVPHVLGSRINTLLKELGGEK